ncbi:conserved hypothetical protein [Beutenbergia cavernae DSM 12333]|uniref:Type VII secretion integral membrane protein EccD n=1 Tax=Beutenbergia cavernae (strain ATCC BAA-8 / DSM 12333 / CCUG 43141 / JCM 11478 / NBRC 16432 / NCIMB 13614 / HKI 0122) TaxID=471853 RepID=C5C0R1_BEUC1|nr:hypothetical protein [Beutenbergia cavernae]ACQ81457.1 conserved hypothetical protein [Beutenbergia cavernae DSM 12333]
MTAPPVDSLRVGVQAGATRHDVVVAPHASVGALVGAIGVDPRAAGLRVVASDGRVLELDAELGDAVATGALVHVVTTAPRAPARSGRRDGGRAAKARADRGAPWWVLAAGLGVVAAGVAGWSVLDGTGPERDLALLAAALLFLAALVTALAAPPVGRAGGAALAAAPLLAFAAGCLAVDPTAYAAGQLGVVVGLLGASLAVALRYVTTYRRRPDAAAAPGVVLALTLVGTALASVGLLAGFPGASAAAVLLGAMPLVLRALPSLSIDVPDALLLDVGVVQRTAGSVREPAARPPGRVRAASVRHAVRTAQARRHTGALVVAVLAPVLGAVTLAGSAAPASAPLVDRLAAYAALAVVAAVAIAFALGPRTARGIIPTVAPRLAAFALLVELAIAVGWSDGLDVAVAPAAFVMIGAGLLAAAWVRPFASGWRSVRWSRTADILESTAVVLAAPLGLVAAGVVAAMRLLASG